MHKHRLWLRKCEGCKRSDTSHSYIVVSKNANIVHDMASAEIMAKRRPTEDDIIQIRGILSTGQTVTKTCELIGVSVPMFYTWLDRRPGFAEIVNSAKAAGADAIIQECVDIADDVSMDMIEDTRGKTLLNQVAVSRAKLKIETRLRVARYLAPMKFAQAQEILKYKLMTDASSNETEEKESVSEKIQAARARASKVRSAKVIDIKPEQ